MHEHSFDIPGQKGINVLLFLSGSVLGCRGKKVPQPGESAKILDGYRRMGLDALIAIGGDGSLEIIAELAQQGNWNLVAVPKTIDNDIPLTERVVGFDTAVDTVAATLHNLSFTAASHDHVMIVEVMGRDGSHLALHAGIAGGADVILIPELVPYLTESVVANVCHKVAQIYRQRRKFALIVVAEGIDGDPLAEPCSRESIGTDLKQQIEQYVDRHSDPQQADFWGLEADLEVRVTVLGRIQRSSPPTTLDRLLAVSFGVKAVDAISQRLGSANAQSQLPSQQMVVWNGGQTQLQPLDRAIAKIKAAKAANLPPCAAPVDRQGFMLHTARSLGIYVGD